MIKAHEWTYLNGKIEINFQSRITKDFRIVILTSVRCSTTLIRNFIQYLFRFPSFCAISGSDIIARLKMYSGIINYHRNIKQLSLTLCPRIQWVVFNIFLFTSLKKIIPLIVLKNKSIPTLLSFILRKLNVLTGWQTIVLEFLFTACVVWSK